MTAAGPRVVVLALLAALTAAVLAVAPGPAAPSASAAPDDAVLSKRKLGESVQGRKIMAYRLGDKSKLRVVLISTMHGNEARPRRILLSLRNGPPISGVDLWVVPTYNPDGLARGTRRNARGVDLNRNFPHRWKDLDDGWPVGGRRGTSSRGRGGRRPRARQQGERDGVRAEDARHQTAAVR